MFHLFISHALPTLWSPATPDIFTVFIDLSFPECHLLGAIQYAIFSDGLLLLSIKLVEFTSEILWNWFCFESLLLTIVLIAEDLLKLSLSHVCFFRLCLSSKLSNMSTKSCLEYSLIYLLMAMGSVELRPHSNYWSL